MKTILIVDDSATIRGQVRSALAPAGYGIVEAEDGEEAITVLLAEASIAMVLCDVNMPRLDGLDMLDALKTRLPGGHPPVVMLTSEGAADRLRRAKAAGARGWIVKPFRPDILLASVQKICGDAGVDRATSTHEAYRASLRGIALRSG